MTSDSTPVKILIVDDDIELQQLLVQYLGEQGFAAEAVGDGVEMQQWLADRQPDLMILDLMLPGEDGLSLARDLRQKHDFPIVMLSARGEELDRIIGLEVGADDYLPKPFNPRELLARIRAVLRRSKTGRDCAESGKGKSRQDDSGRIRFGPFELDMEARLLWKNGAEVELTSGEMALLLALAMRPNRVLTRDQLMDAIAGNDSDSFDRSIDVRITRLRKKLDEQNPPRYIRTVWGQGYRFTPDVS